MNRVAVVAVALAVLVGSVPAAATLSGAQATPEERPAPGAAFAGVVDVQQAEVDSEVAQRALDRRFAAADSNGSKARIVAEQQEQLSERLAELEAEKARLERAHENGSIGEAQYRAQLAALAAQIRAVERRANQTADVAAGLPEPALREHGANVSQVREIAQQANRVGGGEVAEAARAIAGEGVGNGLGPPNASQRGPPERAGPPDGNGATDGAGPPDRNGSSTGTGAPDRNGSSTGAGPPDRNDTGAGTGQPDDVGATANETSDLSDGAGGNGSENASSGVENATADPPNERGTEPGAGEGAQPANGSDVNGTETGDAPADGNESADERGGSGSDDTADGAAPLDDGTETATPTATA